MPILRIHNQEHRIEGLLFDKDGTLLEFMGLWGKWAHLMNRLICAKLASNGNELTMEEISQVLGTKYDSEGNLTGYDAQGPLAMASITQAEALLAWQLYRFGMPWNDAVTEIRRFGLMVAGEIDREKCAKPLPGLLSFLEKCKRLQVPLGVVTADDTCEADKHLNWMGIRHYFAQIIGNDLVEQGKPHPEMVRLACMKLGLEASRIAVIGDTNGDMQMGKTAGAALTIGIRSAADATAPLSDADYVIASYDEIEWL